MAARVDAARRVMLAAPIGIAGAIERLAPRLDDQPTIFDADVLGPIGGIILLLAIIPAVAVAAGVVAPLRRIEPVAVELVGPDEARVGGARHRRVDPVIVRDRRGGGEQGECGEEQPRAHQMWIGLPCTAIAASFTASLCVGWAWQV